MTFFLKNYNNEFDNKPNEMLLTNVTDMQHFKVKYGIARFSLNAYILIFKKNNQIDVCIENSCPAIHFTSRNNLKVLSLDTSL